MLTDEDIKNLTEYQKTVFVTQESFDNSIKELKESFSTLQSAVDKVLKDKEIKDQEALVFAHRMKSTEDWIDQAAPKVGVMFKH